MLSFEYTCIYYHDISLYIIIYLVRLFYFLLCREIRKEMINYCEDEDSSSTDEEDLCKPRPALRNRKNQINYNENALIAQEHGEDQKRPKEKIR